MEGLSIQQGIGAAQKVLGTTTNDNAAAGYVGEFISSNVTAVAITSNVAKDVTSISLTAGDWDVTGNVITSAAATTQLSLLVGYITTASATLATKPNSGSYSIIQGLTATGSDWGFDVGTIRLSLSATTTVYLGAFVTYTTSTLTINGFIGARRVR